MITVSSLPNKHAKRAEFDTHPLNLHTTPSITRSSESNGQVRTPENRGETQTLNYRGTKGATVLRIEVTARDLFVSFYYMSQLRN